jgi:hypothetical protein
VPYTITGTTSGTITSGFVLGGVNTLRLIVNNMGTTSIASPTATFATSNDATDASVVASVTYAVPEPGIGLLCAAAGLLMIPRVGIRKRRGL